MRASEGIRVMESWTQRARSLKLELHALYLACRDRRTPWYVKVIGVCVIGYALSPIDLIPDPIPVIGYLDDLIIVPLGLLLVRWLIPEAVLRDCREQAEAITKKPKRANWIAG